MKTITKRQFNKMVDWAVFVYETEGSAIAAFRPLSSYKRVYASMDAKVHKGKLETESHEAAETVYNYAKTEAEKVGTVGEVRVGAFKAAFTEKLAENFELADPVFAVINRINERIKELESRWNPFRGSRAIKIGALKGLVDDLLEIKKGTTIGQAFTNWRIKFNVHVNRNPRGLNRLITDLEKDYGEEPLESKSTIKSGSSSLPPVSRSLKQQILQFFVNHLETRRSWFQRLITFLFRNSELSAKKEEMCKELIETVESFNGSEKALAKLLKGKKTEHAELSRSYKKHHYNLDLKEKEAVFSRGVFFQGDFVVQDKNPSELAEAFHGALSSL